MHRRQFIRMSGATALGVTIARPRLVALAQTAYTAIDLGVPDGFDAVLPIDLNNNGVALVSASSPDAAGIFLCESGVFTRLGKPGERVYASSINDANQVGGWIEGVNDGSGPTPEYPVLLTKNGQLEMPGERVEGRVYAVASDGRAVGEAGIDADHATRSAVVWIDQALTELQGTPAGSTSAAVATNALGHIVGWLSAEDGRQRRAVRFSLTEPPVELGTLGGSLSEATAVSEQGMIVGNSSTTEEQTDLNGNGTVAFSWSDGVMTALHTFDRQAWSTASGVNSFGMVVGVAGLAAPATASTSTVAVLWTRDAGFDLNQMVQPIAGLTLTAAVAVNEMGQILCTASNAEGSTRAVLLSILGN